MKRKLIYHSNGQVSITTPDVFITSGKMDDPQVKTIEARKDIDLSDLIVKKSKNKVDVEIRGVTKKTFTTKAKT